MMITQISIALILAIITALLVMYIPYSNAPKTARKFIILTIPLFLVSWSGLIWFSSISWFYTNMDLVLTILLLAIAGILLRLVLPSQPSKAILMKQRRNIPPAKRMLNIFFGLGYWIVVAVFTSIVYAGYLHMQAV